ncbi:hypothetical protein CLOSTMETH_01892, partial [[Clostridium] methylpentosum DSM 5476]
LTDFHPSQLFLLVLPACGSPFFSLRFVMGLIKMLSLNGAVQFF